MTPNNFSPHCVFTPNGICNCANTYHVAVGEGALLAISKKKPPAQRHFHRAVLCPGGFLNLSLLLPPQPAPVKSFPMYTKLDGESIQITWSSLLGIGSSQGDPFGKCLRHRTCHHTRRKAKKSVWIPILRRDYVPSKSPLHVRQSSRTPAYPDRLTPCTSCGSVP